MVTLFLRLSVSQSLVFFAGTICTVSAAMVTVVARRYSLLHRACPPHSARGGRKKAGEGVGRGGSFQP